MNFILQFLKHILTLALLNPPGRQFPALTFRIRSDGFGRNLDFWSEVFITVCRHVFSLEAVDEENGVLNTLRL